MNLLISISITLLSFIFMAFNPFEALTSGVGGILGLIHLILWVIAAVNILGSGRSTMSKLIWLLVILFLPIIGLLLYYFIG